MNTPEEREQEVIGLVRMRQEGIATLCLTCAHLHEDYDDFCRPFEPKHRKIKGYAAVVECSGYAYGISKFILRK